MGADVNVCNCTGASWAPNAIKPPKLSDQVELQMRWCWICDRNVSHNHQVYKKYSTSESSNDGFRSSAQKHASVIHCASREHSIFYSERKTGVRMPHCVTARFPIFHWEAIPQFFLLFALWQRNGIFPNKICCKIIIQTENQSNNFVCLFQANTICASASDVNEWFLCFCNWSVHHVLVGRASGAHASRPMPCQCITNFCVWETRYPLTCFWMKSIFPARTCTHLN